MEEKLKSIWNKKSSSIDDKMVIDCRIAAIKPSRFMDNDTLVVTIKLDTGEIEDITVLKDPNLKVGDAILTVTFWNKNSKFGEKPSKTISNL